MERLARAIWADRSMRVHRCVDAASMPGTTNIGLDRNGCKQLSDTPYFELPNMLFGFLPEKSHFRQIRSLQI